MLINCRSSNATFEAIVVPLLRTGGAFLPPRPEGRTFKCPGLDDHGAIIVIIVIKTTVITVVMMTIDNGQHRYDQTLQCPEYSYTVPKC